MSMSAGQYDLSKTSSSAQPVVVVESEDRARSGPGPASSATHHDTVAHLLPDVKTSSFFVSASTLTRESIGAAPLVPSSGSGRGLPSVGGGRNVGQPSDGGARKKSKTGSSAQPVVVVKSEDRARSGPGPASSATHHDTVAHLLPDVQTSNFHVSGNTVHVRTVTLSPESIRQAFATFR